MWKFIKGIFGGGDNASKTMDLVGDSVRGIGNWIDEKEFTPEEKAKSLARAVDAHLELIKATTNENAPRSVTRRWLAWGVAGFMVFWGSIAMVFAIFGQKEIVSSMVAVAEAFYMGLVFLAVMGFYFGVQLLRK